MHRAKVDIFPSISTKTISLFNLPFSNKETIKMKVLIPIEEIKQELKKDCE